jgi:hypothetical protein
LRASRVRVLGARQQCFNFWLPVDRQSMRARFGVDIEPNLTGRDHIRTEAMALGGPLQAVRAEP